MKRYEKIVLTSHGELCLHPENGLLPQNKLCPFVHDDNATLCGDWCVHFGEPQTEHGSIVELEITCGAGRRIIAKTLEDNRPRTNPVKK